MVEGVTGFIELTGRLIRGETDETGFASLCPELGIASQGETIDEALENLKDAIVTFMSTLSESGELAVYLKEHGLRVLDRDPEEERKILAPKGSIISVMVAAMSDGHVAVAV
jgi:predicted RNase H-like HicB family nuclease